MKNKHEKIYAAIRRIPKGRVATYGQVARAAGLPGRARLVGKALAELPGGAGVPWHRVINASGGISERSEPSSPLIQQRRLEREGVVFRPSGTVDLGKFRWRVAVDPAAESFRRLG